LKEASLVVLGWILGLFTLPLSTDAVAKAKCLNKLNELRRVLERLAKRNFPEQVYYDLIMEAKNLFEDINIDLVGLLFCPPNLKQLLADSLTLVRKMDSRHENYEHRVPQTTVRVLMLWNGKRPITSYFESLEKIQQSISGSLLRRTIDVLYSRKTNNATSTPQSATEVSNTM
jgi:hypothetical protein